MQDESITPIKIRTALYIFKRHKWKLLTIFFSTVVMVTVGSLLATPIYRASAQLLVKPGREDVYVSPTGSSPAVIDDSWEGQKVKAEISIIKSLDLAMQLVDRVGVERLFDYPTLFGRLLKTDNSPEIPPVEKVYKKVRRNLNATAESRSNVINITFDWPDPVIAAETVNNLLDLYLVQHLKVHTNPKTYYLLEGQAKKWERKLKESEKELETFKRLNSITSLSEQRTLLLGRLSDAATQQRETEGEIQETRAMVLALGRQLSKLQQNVPLQETVDQNSATLAALKARLADLELQGIKEEIEQVKKMIAEEEKREGKIVTSGRSPIRQNLESDLIRAKTRLKALQAKLKNQEIQVAKYEAEIESLDALEKQLHQLQREVSINEGNYRLYLAKFEETNISESMDKENISNVRIIEHAVPVMKPIKPRKRLNVMIAAFAGLVVGVTVVFVFELVNPVFHTREDVQQFLNIPVLAILPKMEAESDKQPPTAKRKLKRLLSKYLKSAA